MLSQRRMTAVVNSDHAASKLLWSGEVVNTVGGGGSPGGALLAKAPRLVGSQTWTSNSSSKMSRSQGHNVGEVVGGNKVLLTASSKEQTSSKHTWPRRRDVSSLCCFLLSESTVNMKHEEGVYFLDKAPSGHI